MLVSQSVSLQSLPPKFVIEQIKKQHCIPDHNGFERKTIPHWLPDNNPVQVHVRTFQTALKSLFSKFNFFKESNLSLPNSETPHCSRNEPPVSICSELHHGTWWRETFQSKCNPSKKEMLVPIILHMDGISVDKHGKLSLTPLNMTLGTFSTDARKMAQAWETLYFHPDSSHMSELM